MISHRSKQFVYPDYISPLPADEFLKAATYKQKMYDEGVTLVNKQLDAYQSIRDSLDKEQDRKYFDQEASKFVNALNKNSSLDLSVKSNLQATLQSGNQLVHDPYIKQAAESSAVRKKMIEEQSKLDPSKRSQINDYFFNKEIENWYNDGKVGSKLAYNPYTVYTDEHIKLWSTLVDKMKPDTTEEYIQDKSGAWITKVTYTGKSAEKLQGAYQDGLSPQAQNQLRMEAQYQLETGDKDKLSQDYTQYNQIAVQQLGTEIAKAETSRGEYVKKYGENSPEASKLTNDIYQLKLKQSIYEENANKAPENGDLVSYLINDKILTGSNEWAYQQAKKDTIANPYVVDREKMKNNIIEAEAKAQINDKYGLNADGTKSTGSNLFGIDPVTAVDLSKTVSGLNGSKTVQNLSSNLNIVADDADAPYLISGIRAFSGVGLDGSDTKTIKDIVKRAMVSGTWANEDREEILSTMAGKNEIAKGVQANKMNVFQANSVIESNKKKATTWLDYAKKIGTSIYDVYDLQTGAVSDNDPEDLTAANITNQLLTNNYGLSIKNNNTQSKWASDLKTNIKNSDKAETFNSDGTGLTFVPKNNNVYVFRRDNKGKLVKLVIETQAFLDMPASYLNGIEDIRLPID
jgi:hypothetical protein